MSEVMDKDAETARSVSKALGRFGIVQTDQDFVVAAGLSARG